MQVAIDLLMHGTRLELLLHIDTLPKTCTYLRRSHLFCFVDGLNHLGIRLSVRRTLLSGPSISQMGKLLPSALTVSWLENWCLLLGVGGVKTFGPATNH